MAPQARNGTLEGSDIQRAPVSQRAPDVQKGP